MDKRLATCSSMGFVWESLKVGAVLVQWTSLMTCCGLSVEKRSVLFQGLRPATHVMCLNVMVAEFYCTAQWLCEFDFMIRLSGLEKKLVFT